MTLTSATSAATTSLPDARTLRLLYFTRTVVSIVWVALVFAFAMSAKGDATPSAIVVILLVIYPLWDAAATLIDRRANGTATSRLPQFINIALDVLAAIGIGVAISQSLAAAVGVFGAWAFVAGAIQLLLGIRRRKQGGQWAMIASGGISVVAGVSFITTAIAGTGAVTSLGGYSAVGALWFLIAALFLTRTVRADAARP